MDEHIRKHRRLVILRCLLETASYRSNSSVLATVVDAHWAVPSTRDQVRADIAWLAEMGFVKCESISESVDSVELTQAGEEVAKGSRRVPGVQPPSPRSS